LTELKKTLVLGASLNPSRFAYTAVRMLAEAGHPVLAVGRRKGAIGEVEIQTGLPLLQDIHTVTLYLNPDNQQMYYDYILETVKPERIIFNPGTENDTFKQEAILKGIRVEEQCTLQMLAMEMY
jgi:uncharacterized protein